MSASSRLVLCALLSLAPAGAIVARLTRLQILQRGALAAKASEETQRVSLEIVPRGRILDREGRVLAESIPAWSSFLDPKAVRRPDSVVSQLAKLLKLPPAELRRKLRARSRFVWLKRKMTLDELDALQALKLEGVGVVPDQDRAYPNGALARDVLGRVGADGGGLSGLELQFDSSLAGRPVKLRFMRDGSGKAVTLQPAAAPSSPPDLRLALDRNVQHYAESALDEGVARFHPKRGLVLVQDPRTGDLLAMAAYPHDPLKTPALQDAYEPGSTFKLVTFAAYLEEGLDRAGKTYDGEGGRWELAPRIVIKDHEPAHTMTLADVLERSSNIGSAKIGLEIGPERFFRYAQTFGFGVRTGLAYPGESAGLLKRPKELTRVSLANNAFGQGVAVTPVQLVAAYSAVADGGMLLDPRLVLEAGGKSQPAPPPVRRVVTAATDAKLVSLLEGVVENGTGLTAQVPGYWIAGKTGTAQKIDPKTRRYSPTDYVASFIGFAPSRAPRFTALVLMDSPKGQYYGTEVAAPLFATLMRELLALDGVPTERPIVPKLAKKP